MNAMNLQQQKSSAKAAEPAKQLAREQSLGSDQGPATVASDDRPGAISADQRRELIAIAAYYRAERRGFAGGSAEQDWLDAEAEIDRKLGQQDS